MNDYDSIYRKYKRTSTKPDKRFSILPTVLGIISKIYQPGKSLKRTRLKGVNNQEGSSIVDLGCGDGFFTYPLSRMYPDINVLGIDNSNKQIQLAKERYQRSNLLFYEGNVFKSSILKVCIKDASLILVPFILGYLNEKQLVLFIKRMYRFCPDGCAIVFVIDEYLGVDNSKYGARKRLEGKYLYIDLFSRVGKFLLTLKTMYHSIIFIKRLLKAQGFRYIKIHNPVISKAGLNQLGKKWWGDYIKRSELVYITCLK
jgi:ubiquinone/menaquinone biosynthesis C-methylase UbiE